MLVIHVLQGVYTSTLAVNSDTKGQMVDESYEFRGKHLTVYDRTKWEAHFKVSGARIGTVRVPLSCIVELWLWEDNAKVQAPVVSGRTRCQQE